VVRKLGIVLSAVLVAAVALDPFTYSHFGSYDVLESVWWKPALAAVDAALLLGTSVLLWAGRREGASWLAAADVGLAISLGLAVGHRDMIRIALEGWVPFQVLGLVYLLTLLLRAALFGLIRASRPLRVAVPAI